MGISLFGLTPAATYPSLIKFGDNSAISGTLRALSDGLGNDLPIQVSTAGVNFTGTLTVGGAGLSPASGISGAIQFTDGSAFASDAANFFWDDTNNRLGIRTNSPTATTHIKGVDQLSTSTSLLVQDSIGTNILRVHNQANNSAVVMTTAKIANYEIISGDVLFNTSMRFVPTTGGLAINKDYSTAASNTLVHLKGSGSTSATTSLLVQNSAGTAALTVRDDGVVQVLELIRPTDGTTNSFLKLSNATGTTMQYAGGFVTVSPNFRFGSTTLGSILEMSSATGKFLLGGGTQDASAKMQLNSTTEGFLPPRMTTTQRNAIATPATGLQIYNSTTNTNDTYNGTAWQSNSVSGVAGAIQFSNGSAFASDAANLFWDDTNNRLGVGTNAPTATGHFKGSGLTGATNSFLVQNGSGSNTFRVRDDGNVFCEGGGGFTSVGIIGTLYGLFGGASYTASASLVCGGTTTGFLPPRMTTTQKNAIATPAAGLQVFDTTFNQMSYFNGTVWINF